MSEIIHRPNNDGLTPIQYKHKPSVRSLQEEIDEIRRNSDSFQANYAEKIESLEEKDAELTTQLAETEKQFEAVKSYEIFEPPLASNEWVTDGTGRVLNMTTSEFLSLFYDGYVGNHANGYTVTKTSLGKDQSGTYDIYEYDFKPSNYSKTILLSSGMHTFELSAHFGLAHFMNHLMKTPFMHEGFKYLRENVRIKVIPVINPWGWNQNPKKYGNVNGVNINRNFDSGGRWASFPDATDEFNKKGSAPFSEKETQILRAWAQNNNTAKFWIDMHTGLDLGPWDNFIYYLSNSPLRQKIEQTLAKLEDRIRMKYNKPNPTKEIRIDSDGSIRHWFSQVDAGIPTFTLEQTPNNPLWGTALNNEAGDITEFEVTIAAYVFNFLDVETTYLKEYVNSVNNKLTHIGDEVGEIKELSKDFATVDTRLSEFELFMLRQLDTVVFDRFNRPNSTTLGNAETGQAWVDYPDNVNNPTARLGISNGKAVEWITDAGGNKTVLDSGISNFIVSADIKINTYAGIIFRFVDLKNLLMARINPTGVALSKVVNGTSTTLGNHAFTPVVGKTYNLKVSVKDGDLKVYLDDALVISATDTTHQTATKIGFRTHLDKNSSFDNFIVRRNG